MFIIKSNTNKSCCLKWSCFSNVSGLALHQWHCKYVSTGARFFFTYEVKIKNFLVRGGSARSLEEREGKSPGAPVARYPPPPPQSMSVVKGVTNRVEYTAAGKPVPILLAAPKVLAKTFSLSIGDYSNGEIFSTGKHLKNEHPIRTYFNYSFKIN